MWRTDPSIKLICLIAFQTRRMKAASRHGSQHTQEWFWMQWLPLCPVGSTHRGPLWQCLGDCAESSCSEIHQVYQNIRCLEVNHSELLVRECLCIHLVVNVPMHPSYYKWQPFVKREQAVILLGKTTQKFPPCLSRKELFQWISRLKSWPSTSMLEQSSQKQTKSSDKLKRPHGALVPGFPSASPLPYNHLKTLQRLYYRPFNICDLSMMGSSPSNVAGYKGDNLKCEGQSMITS